jgi:hypothetical protein
MLRSRSLQVTASLAGWDAEAWEALTSALEVKGLPGGQRWTTPAGVSPLGGVLEYLTENPYDAPLRLDTPGPGIAALGAVNYPGGQGVVAMNLYLYGDQADATVAREKPLCDAWLSGIDMGSARKMEGDHPFACASATSAVSGIGCASGSG